MISPPGEGTFHHEAVLYSSVDEVMPAVVPFLEDGVASGEAVSVVCSPEINRAITAAVPPRIAGAIAFEQPACRYTTAARTLATFQRTLMRHARSGQRTRVLTQPPFSRFRPEQVHEFCRGDAAANVVSAVPGATVACLYDTGVLPDWLLELVWRSHPRIVADGLNVPSDVFTDPAALLTADLRGPPLPPPSGDVEVLHAPADAASAREFVRDAARRRGLDEPELSAFTTAVNEVATNGMTHSILDRMLVWADGGRLLCEVRDIGFGLTDPLAGYRLPEHDATSGRGLWLARQLTDLIEMRSGPSGSTFRLHMACAGAEAGVGR